MTQTTLVKWQVLACVGLVWQVYSGSATAQSTAGSFSSVVTIGGSVKQEANGNNNTQVINAGGMNASKTGSFNSTVSVGGITQTTTGSGGVQTLNAGSMSNSSAGSFTANVNAGKLEQTGKGGERQEMDIGSVTNSTVSGSVNTTVNVRQGVKQVGEGEIAIGAVKNSNIGSFNNSITVNKVEGNNVRIGSVVGGGVYDNKGRLLNKAQTATNNTNAVDRNPNSLQLPNFSTATNSSQQPLFGADSTISNSSKNPKTKSSVTKSTPTPSNWEQISTKEKARVVWDSFGLALQATEGVISASDAAKLTALYKAYDADVMAALMNKIDAGEDVWDFAQQAAKNRMLLESPTVSKLSTTMGALSAVMYAYEVFDGMHELWNLGADATAIDQSDLVLKVGSIAPIVSAARAPFILLDVVAKIVTGDGIADGFKRDIETAAGTTSNFNKAIDNISNDLAAGRINANEANRRFEKEKTFASDLLTDQFKQYKPWKTPAVMFYAIGTANLGNEERAMNGLKGAIRTIDQVSFSSVIELSVAKKHNQ